jgi:hypothetical protein
VLLCQNSGHESSPFAQIFLARRATFSHITEKTLTAKKVDSSPSMLFKFHCSFYAMIKIAKILFFRFPNNSTSISLNVLCVFVNSRRKIHFKR